MKFANLARNYLEVDLTPADSISFDTMVSYVAKASDLAEQINFNAGVYYPEKDILQIDSEVGDDHICFTQCPQVSLMESTMANVLFNMEVSLPDTFVSKTYGTFTGRVAIMPQDHFDHYSQTKVKRGGEEKQTIVVDIPALRTVVNVSPQVKMNTSSLEGRLSYLSRAQSYSRGTNEEKIVETISLLQDITHCIMTQGDKFPYLPSFMGGYDKPAPFGSKANLERAIHAFKRGRYRGLITTIIQSFFDVLFEGARKTRFLTEIKSLYSGYQAWYVNYKRNFPLFSGKLPPEFWQYKVPDGLNQSAISSMVLRRLTAEGVLVRERDLIVANEVQEYFKALISEDVSVFQASKSEIEKKFRSETKIANCFQELVQGSFDVLIVPATDEALTWAARIDIADSRAYRNAFGEENLFWRSALDELYLRSPLKVSFPLIGKRYKVIGTESGIYQDEFDDEDESVKRLISWMGGDMEKFPYPPSEILEDDDIIIAKVLHSRELLAHGPFPVVLIITNDVELCRRINNETTIPVVRLPPEFLLIARTGRFGLQRAIEPLDYFKRKLVRRIPGFASSLLTLEHDNHVFADFGSYDASAVRFDTSPFMRQIQHTEVRSDQIFEYRVLDPGDPVSQYQRRYDAWPIGHLFDDSNLIQISEFGTKGSWRQKDDKPKFNPFSVFNRSSRRKTKTENFLVSLIEGSHESIMRAAEVEREHLLSLPNS